MTARKPWELWKAIRSHPKLETIYQRAVLWDLVAHDGAACYPSDSTIADHLAVSWRCVFKTRHQLRDLGALSWRGGRHTNVYTIDYDWITRHPVQTDNTDTLHGVQSDTVDTLHGVQSDAESLCTSDHVTLHLTTSHTAPGAVNQAYDLDNHLDSSSSDSAIPFQKIMSAWNDQVPHVKMRSLAGKRRGAVRARCAEYGVDGVLELIAKVAGSTFLTTTMRGGKGCTCDWPFLPNNAQKILEGAFDGKFGRHSAAAQSAEGASHDW